MDSKHLALTQLVEKSDIIEIMSMAQAINHKCEDCGYFLVSYWGEDDKPLPVGFIRYDVQSVSHDTAHVLCYGEPKNFERDVPLTDWILCFHKRPGTT